ncbi:hypothetical protein PL75_07315 [Neisseria arctica]|uniref:Uncharacterized protein n=1 Tax=Neisseria arctica TaxID=1470200 RepID=A0A0J0YRC4_9NEIS|nr:hypothetical protein PL75_07315 [Neisseria arctica]
MLCGKNWAFKKIPPAVIRPGGIFMSSKFLVSLSAVCKHRNIFGLVDCLKVIKPFAAVSDGLARAYTINVYVVVIMNYKGNRIDE